MASSSESDAGSTLVRSGISLVANVTAVTALLVYFGWRRSQTQAQRLGIDESILGMSTRDYVIRSVGPVLVLLCVIGIAGLLWSWLRGYLTDWFQRHPEGRATAVALTGLSLAWLLLPMLMWALSGFWIEGTYVLFPASIGAGVLLMLYAGHLRYLFDRSTWSRGKLVPASVGLIVAVCVFWTASNYAEVLGNQFANEFIADVRGVPGVTVYSKHQLHLTAPGALETPLATEQNSFRYRYTGLRLLEHTGGQYFLVSDEWTPEYGVVIALPDREADVRLEFVRDRRVTAAIPAPAGGG